MSKQKNGSKLKEYAMDFVRLELKGAEVAGKVWGNICGIGFFNNLHLKSYQNLSRTENTEENSAGFTNKIGG